MGNSSPARGPGGQCVSSTGSKHDCNGRPEIEIR
jgi:hypothetical protein